MSVDGKTSQGQLDVAATISKDRTMLPVRFVGEVIGADVQWDAATRTASFSKDGLTATVQIDGQQIVLSNGKTVDMDSAPLNVDGRILLPLTNISQIFSLTQGNVNDGIGQDIEWDGQNRTVTIKTQRAYVDNKPEPKAQKNAYVLAIGSKGYTLSKTDGEVLQGQMDVAAIISNGRTMLPVRFVGEVIGADVQWDAATRTASFSKDGLTATVQIDGQQIVLSNGKTVDMDSAPLNVDGRILLPLTNISQIFSLTQGNVNDGIGQDIEWDGQNRTVTIKTQRAYVDNKPEPKAQKNAYVLAIGSKGYTLSKTDGEVLQGQMDVAAIISNGRTMLPVRFVGEVIGADVQWDAATRTASFSKDGLTATIQIDGQQIVLSDGRTVDMDSAPLNVDGRILLPLTNISQVFSLTQGNTKDGIDQDIEWDGDSRTVTIRA